jgi:hypothetical protein
VPLVAEGSRVTSNSGGCEAPFGGSPLLLPEMERFSQELKVKDASKHKGEGEGGRGGGSYKLVLKVQRQSDPS